MQKRTITIQYVMIAGVYGYGRFGKLWAQILSERHEVLVADPIKSISKPVSENAGYRMSPVNDFVQCDLIFLCTPISETLPVIRSLAQYIEPGTIIADTCSVKQYPLENIVACLDENIPVIGTHPLFGPDSYQPNIPMRVITCSVRATAEQKQRFHDFFSVFPFTLEEMEPEEHDKLMAYTQCLTHFVGRILGDLPLRGIDYATKGYRALTEIVTQTGNDSEQLFYDMHMYNPHAQSMREHFLDKTTSLVELIDSKMSDILEARDGEIEK